ncbi:MAG: hypothetical protein ABIR70_06915 [Bryobacteraceae bacterium]
MSKWMPSGLGAEPKKVMFLIGLVVLSPAAYYYGTSTDTPVTPPSSTKTTRAAVPVIEPTAITRPAPRPAARNVRAGSDDFHPSLKLPDDFDLSKVDPTLRTELLARVRQVEGGSSRSLFDFFTPPPPPPPPVKPIIPTATKVDAFAEAAKPTPPVKATPPPPPPIPLKYFGYEGTPRGGSKLRALFVEGDEYFVVGENDMVKNRYRIVRIGTTSAEVEDTVSKNKQTLRIIDRQDP